jgi:ElaB/YqjD/DUF883 family membrane-anchored ribosome-binding protein
MASTSHSSTTKASQAAHGMADTLREKGCEARDTIQQMGASAKEMAQAGWETARDTAGEYLDKGRQKAKEFGETLDTQIRTRPIPALLIAAGIGFLAAMLLSRGRD